MSSAIHWYEAHAAEVAPRYESVAAERLHGWLTDLLPAVPAHILDIGAGTGRDAAWLASRGYEVVAVEPSGAMRAEAQRRHSSPAIRWIADALPALERTLRLGLAFDMILLSAVWMHVPPEARSRAFRKLVTLLKPGGLIAITLRYGPAEPERAIHPVTLGEIERLAREHGAFVVRIVEDTDQVGRDSVRWIQIAVRLPDDGTGALPLLRHIILNDDKSSTYKLALLRTLCRIADGAAGYARDASDEHVAVPLGLVGLYWIRLFKPLLDADLPQSPINRGDTRLSFAKAGFRRLAGMSHLDLRIGTQLSEDRTQALHDALRDACDTITRMPATFITYPGGGRVLPVQRLGRIARPDVVRLDEAYLASFGTLLVPRHLWRALQRFEVWIEPALIAEWVRLMKAYAARQGRTLEEGTIAAAMTWSEPNRDVRLAREQALRLLDGVGLHCVWSGRRLTLQTLDIDHCFPWAAWPCEDLWNLLPAHRSVNRNQKRDRLPGPGLLRSARDRIQCWWDLGYLRTASPVLPDRFLTEARASLPLADGGTLDDIFAGLAMQHLRLQQDQQVPVWEPEGITLPS